MSEFKASLWLKNVPGAEPVEVTLWSIKDLTDVQLKRLNAFKKGHYTAAQATEMADWVNTRQTDFGIHDIIHRGLVEAAERIAVAYLSQAKGAGSTS